MMAPAVCAGVPRKGHPVLEALTDLVARHGLDRAPFDALIDAHIGRVREQVSVALYPLQWLATMPFTLAQHAGSFFTRQAELLNENRQLNNARLSAATQTMQLKQLEAENARLRRAVADLTLDKLILKEAASGNW